MIAKFNLNTGECVLPNKEVFLDFRRTHTIKETESHFGLSQYMMEKLLNLFGIRKHHAEQRMNCPNLLTQKQHEIITGNLLGDGSLSKLTSKSKNSLFEIKQKLDKSEYLKLLFEHYAPFSKNYSEGASFRKNKTSHWCKIRTISHPVFTQYRDKWYKDNIKIIPDNLKLTWQTAAFGACDDGSNWGGRIFRLHTNGFTFKDTEKILEKVQSDLFVLGSINKINNKPVIVFCGDNAFNFMEGIKQFVPDCYKYKTLNRLSKYKARRCKCLNIKE